MNLEFARQILPWINIGIGVDLLQQAGYQYCVDDSSESKLVLKDIKGASIEINL